MINEFKTLVKSVSEQISTVGPAIQDMYHYVGLLAGSTTSLWDVKEKLSSEIELSIATTGANLNSPSLNLQSLEDLLVYDCVLYNNDNTEFLNVVSKLKKANKLSKPFEDKKSWITAIRCAKDMIYLDYEVLNMNDPDEAELPMLKKLREDFPRQFDIAQASVGLRELGCEVSLNDNSILYTGLGRIEANLEGAIRDMGGINLMRFIFTLLVEKHQYCYEFNRFVIARNMGVVPYHVEPLVPFGYLLNLAVKYPYETKVLKTQRNKIDQLINTATYLSTIQNIQSYSKFDNIFSEAKNFPSYIRNLALFDTVFTFPSTDLNDVIEINRNLFKWVNQSVFAIQYGFTIDNIHEVTECIKNISSQIGPDFIYLSKIKKKLSLSEETILLILSCLSHSPEATNSQFKEMSEYRFIDFGFKPLIKISDTKYLLCDKSWCAIGFYEAIATLVREQVPANNQSNNQIGLAIEKFVYKKLTEKGISFFNGNYVDGINPAGEVDVLIESSDCIDLIEIKKKPLTRLSRSGNDINLIVDLAQSLFDAQIQAGRTEILLRKNGRISLEDDGNEKTIQLKNKRIERIALTQWDFGSFQDRMVINKILTILDSSEIKLIDDNSPDANSITKIREKQLKWKAQAEELSTIDSSFDEFPYFNCWFLSLPQLLLILRYSKDNESFHKAVSSTKHVTVSANNFYIDFLYFFVRTSN